MLIKPWLTYVSFALLKESYAESFSKAIDSPPNLSSVSIQISSKILKHLKCIHSKAGGGRYLVSTLKELACLLKTQNMILAIKGPMEGKTKSWWAGRGLQYIRQSLQMWCTLWWPLKALWYAYKSETPTITLALNSCWLKKWRGMNNEDRSHKPGEGKLRHRQESEKRKCLERNVNTQKEQ